jgi:hypothetical protein
MDKAKRKQLLTDGFCQAPAVLSDDMLRRLRAATDLMLDKQTEEHKGYNELHDLIAEPHSEELGQAKDLDRAELSEARSAEGRELAVRLHPVYEADAEPHGRMLRPRLSA